MLKGKKLKLKIDSMSHGSAALAKHDGLAVFVDNACPGDEILAEVYDDRKTFAFASLEEFEKASEYRNHDPKCKLHKVCGGCQWQHIDYAKQLEFKRKNIIDLFYDQELLENRNLDNELIREAIGMDNPWNYRNKVIFPVETIASTGRLHTGYYKKNTHDLINIKYCPIQYSVYDQIMEAIKDLAQDYGIGKPPLRHIALRSNIDQSEILVTFIIRKKSFDEDLQVKFSELAKDLAGRFDEIKGIALNYNDMSTNVIMGHETETIWGEDYIVDQLANLKFRLSPTSFFQINNQQALKLVETVGDFAELSSGQKVLDAYAGIGTIALSLAKKQDLRVTAIEIVESAVNDGIKNAELNGIKNVDYRCGKVEDYIEEFQDGDFDLVIVNPPRKGCTNKVLDALANIKSKKIVYVSCNPASLARDIKHLEPKGYKLKKLQPIDLFPHTYHIESVCLLERS